MKRDINVIGRTATRNRLASITWLSLSKGRPMVSSGVIATVPTIRRCGVGTETLCVIAISTDSMEGNMHHNTRRAGHPRPTTDHY